MLDKAFDSFDDSLKKPDISMTPLIDMVFILLIFFVVTTTFTKETGIVVNKAKATTSQLINKNLFVVAVGKDGAFWYNSTTYELQQIIPIIISEYQKNSELNIVIVPDKDGRVEPLISLLDALRAKNITRFSIGTKKVE